LDEQNLKKELRQKVSDVTEYRHLGCLDVVLRHLLDLNAEVITVTDRRRQLLQPQQDAVGVIIQSDEMRLHFIDHRLHLDVQQWLAGDLLLLHNFSCRSCMLSRRTLLHRHNISLVSVCTFRCQIKSDRLQQ